MRVLFTVNPDKSVFLSMVPLAWALRAAGHEVRVASQPGFAGIITQAGLTAVGVGRDTDVFGRIKDQHPEEYDAQRARLPQPYEAATLTPEQLDWAAMRDGYQHVLRFWHKHDNFPSTAELVTFAKAWRPDLVIWEPTTYSGAIAAKACGAAHARLLWSIDVFGVTRDRYQRLRGDRTEDPLADWLGGYARKYGYPYDEDMVTGQFTIDPLPDSMRMDAGLERVPMQYVPYGGPAVVPKWLWTAPERPRVAVTLGITATERFAGYAADVREILDAVADLDIEVVATIAASEQHRLTRIPDNTRVLSFVPLQALAPTCAAVISHAGPGTFLTTALYGVPQLTLPWDFDEPELARRAAEQGGTLVIDANRATGQVVRESLLRLLREPRFAERAGVLRDELRALPSPGEIVGRLEELTVKYRTASR
ncbi:activator-dependent family glycosyltransferase [Actinoplanes sp. NEAU-A12]|uniref:Activator-dependent family glycosyltransferase n=2 Tax=Actinoplanes sandaracinus TaxID=3045177 RepID=A0ABT6WZI5_9ACTN|nr:activator-dependent family glycosyltransferase [Actinoplanes sandaracinus]